MLFALSIAMTSSAENDDVIIGIAWEKNIYITTRGIEPAIL